MTPCAAQGRQGGAGCATGGPAGTTGARRGIQAHLRDCGMVLRLDVRTLNISRSCEITVSSPYLGIFDRIFVSSTVSSPSDRTASVSSTVSSYLRPYLLLQIGQCPYLRRIFVSSEDTAHVPQDTFHRHLISFHQAGHDRVPHGAGREGRRPRRGLQYGRAEAVY